MQLLADLIFRFCQVPIATIKYTLQTPYARDEKQKLLTVLIVNRPFPMDGGMVEDHEAPEAGQLSRVWTRGRRETKSRQRASGAKSP